MAGSSVGIGSIDQVAVVVRDLDRAMERYTNEVGIGPWSVYMFSPDWIRMTFRGEERGYVMKLALAQVGGVMYELIEPVQGPNTYEEFLNARGEGLHHLGYFVEDIDAAIEEMEGKGFPLLQSGRGFGAEGDGAYAYFETEDALGHIHRRGHRDAPSDVRPREDLPAAELTPSASSNARRNGCV